MGPGGKASFPSCGKGTLAPTASFKQNLMKKELLATKGAQGETSLAADERLLPWTGISKGRSLLLPTQAVLAQSAEGYGARQDPDYPEDNCRM